MKNKFINRFNIFKFRIDESSPLSILGFLIIVILFAEFTIMMAFEYFASVNHIVNSIIDSVILISIITPFLYFLFYKPTLNYIRACKTMAENIEESEKKFRTMIETAHDMIWTLDKDGNFTFANKQLEYISGYTVSEWIGKNFSLTVYPEDLQKVVDSHSQVLDGKPQSLITRIIDRAGKIKTLSINSSPLIKNDVVTGVLGFGRDITDRRQRELERSVMSEITESVTTTSNLYELLSTIHQSLKKVVYAENFYVALYDPLTELYNFPYYIDEFSSTPEPNPMLKKCTRYVCRNGKSMLRTKELFAQLVEQNEVEAGNPDPKSWVGIPLHSPSTIIGVLVLQHYEEENIYSERDISLLDTIGSQIALVIERKIAEEELKISESRLAEAQRLGKLGTIDWNLITNVVELSEESSRIHGFAEGVNILPIEELVKMAHPEDVERVNKSLMDAIEGKAEHNMEHRIIRADGKVVYLHTMAKIFRDSNNKPIRLLVTNLDITERKMAEQEIQQKNKELQILNSEKDKFFSIIAHDLRSPFNGFLGLTQIMAEELQSLNPNQLQKIVESLRNSAGNLYALLENLLHWARAEQGLIPFIPKVTDLNYVVNECVKLVQEASKSKEIEIYLNIPKTITVFADANMVQTVIRNLISNAMKFTPKGGNINLSAMINSENIVEISIKDSGIGMNQKLLDNLFHINVKTNRKGTNEEPSSGLGLLLCKDFVKKNGGKIWVESEENKGSVFYFTLPLTEF